MDIVSRLKTFMESAKISSSQFADTCGISRPTLSQILNGRNKKISDELISKIHENYPQLSVLWLMFGEGDMVNDANIKISEPQNDKIKTDSAVQSSELLHNSGLGDLFFGLTDMNSKNSESNSGQLSIPELLENAGEDNDQKENEASRNTSSTPILVKSGKKITNIVVFYADNTFETFSPNQ